MKDRPTNTLTALWTQLPKELRERLMLGFTGKRHLLDIAGWCLGSGNNDLAPIATDALLTAFAENPLDGEMLRELLSHDVIRGILPAPTVTLMDAVASSWSQPANTGYLERLLAQRDMDKLKRYLTGSAEKEPDNLFWAQQAVTYGLIDNDPAWVASILSIQSDALPDEANTIIQGRIAVMAGDHDTAVRHFQSLGPSFGPVFPAMQSGLSLIRQEDHAAGNLLLIDCLGQSPWNPNLLLGLHDSLTGRNREARPLDGSVAVLLYTWNKDIEIDATLRSLFDSDLTGASIVVLDNGSTDSTASVLESWQTRFENRLGHNRFTVITLPVNIGAPAARNWLMHDERVSAHDFICYLDDDVIMPADWLHRLGAAVHRYPEAGVWGCKVVDHHNPILIQSGDNHLMVPDEPQSPDLSSPTPNPFKLSDLHIQTTDQGQFDFVRPCASVTGCCHLFRTNTLLDSGDFAIHLSPTQYDDMEHDLRLCLSDRFPVYQGHLTIRHRKRTGTASHTSSQEEGNALGNKYKMQTMHTREELRVAMHNELALLEKDILEKMALIEQM